MACSVVLLPGMDGTGDLFVPLAEALSPDVPTVLVRYPDVPLDYSAHERIAADSLPKTGSYVVLGESFSGPIAISIAARAPPGMLGCILCVSFARSPRRLLRLLIPLLRMLPPQQVPGAITSYFLMGRFKTTELRLLQAETLRKVSPATLVARLKSIATVDVSDTLRRLSMPTLYLRATEDRLVPRSAAATFSNLASAGRVISIEGPHLLLQTNPNAAADTIRQFIREIA